MTTTQKTYGANVQKINGKYFASVGIYEGLLKVDEVKAPHQRHTLVEAWQDANALRAELIHKAEAVRIPVKDNN